MNTKAFYKLTDKRNEIEGSIETYNVLIRELREEAKKLKKGSIERQELMKRANDLNNDAVYVKLKGQLEILNFCINTVFYN